MDFLCEKPFTIMHACVAKRKIGSTWLLIFYRKKKFLPLPWAYFFGEIAKNKLVFRFFLKKNLYAMHA